MRRAARAVATNGSGENGENGSSDEAAAAAAAAAAVEEVVVEKEGKEEEEEKEEEAARDMWRRAGVWVTHSPLKWDEDAWKSGWLPGRAGADTTTGGGGGGAGEVGREWQRQRLARQEGQGAEGAALGGEKEKEKEEVELELGLMEVMDSFFSMAEVSSTYFMCRSRSMAAIASYLAQLQPLSIAERYVLCSVPVNARDRLAMQMLYQFAAARAARRPMPLSIRLPREPPRTLLGMNELCTKNSILDAYLWLSHKFPSTFVQREGALEMRQTCIELLEQGIKMGMTVEHDHTERDAVLRRQYAVKLERLRARGAPTTAPGLPLPAALTPPPLPSSPFPAAAQAAGVGMRMETEAEAALAAAASLESASSLAAVRIEEDDGYENDDEEEREEREQEGAEDERERAALLATEGQEEEEKGKEKKGKDGKGGGGRSSSRSSSK
jgi:hypothetical protein